MRNYYVNGSNVKLAHTNVKKGYGFSTQLLNDQTDKEPIIRGGELRNGIVGIKQTGYELTGGTLLLNNIKFSNRKPKQDQNHGGNIKFII